MRVVAAQRIGAACVSGQSDSCNMKESCHWGECVESMEKGSAQSHSMTMALAFLRNAENTKAGGVRPLRCRGPCVGLVCLPDTRPVCVCTGGVSLPGACVQGCVCLGVCGTALVQGGHVCLCARGRHVVAREARPVYALLKQKTSAPVISGGRAPCF